MSIRELAQLVWRCEYGRLAASALELELRDEVRRLQDARAVQGNPVIAARWSAGDLFTRRDDAIRAAALAIDNGRYRDALREIRHGEQSLLDIAALAEANRDVDAASVAVADIRQLAGTGFLRALPAVASLGPLVESMTRCMLACEYRQASDLAGLCTRMAAPLRERRAPQPREFDARIAAVSEIYDATRAVADEAELDPTRDGSLKHLRRLLDQHQTAFAARLLTETEIALIGRRRFRLHFRERLQSDDVAELKQLVAQHSWHGAVDSDWLEALGREAVTLAGYAKRAESAAVNLDAAFNEGGERA